MVLGAIQDTLGCFQGTQCSNQQVFVIIEHCLILNGIAKTLDLLTDLGLGVKVLLERHRYAIVTKISVLNWSWIAVSILDFPFSLLGLEVLVGNVTQFNLMGWHDELLASISTLWLRLKEGKDWNGANSPLRWMFDHVLNCNRCSIDS